MGLTLPYFAPSISAGFMGASAPQKSYEGNYAYFQNYRNETISRIQTPRYEWGMLDTPFTPRVMGSKKSNLLDLPKSEISMIDRSRQQEVDDFYKICQLHREQYMDHSGSLQPLDYFKRSEYYYQDPTDPTSVYLKYPDYFVEYRKPQVLPLTLNNSYATPLLPQRVLTGVFDPTSSIAYKR